MMEFELRVDGKRVGKLQLIMTPIGIGVACTGDVEVIPLNPKATPPEPMAVPDNFMLDALNRRRLDG